ncbi:hypothetical protein D9758_009980 [Tetrapyrgos nigripes]|uniref:Transmembrane protein n=1 Tax=Tetrapyrgos nigripes TaxID=182062 RepID=A0A8H5FR63_9AGAR|nr:hypothetical protein D9758_009980 [Tetrapyrgos nigripes]
MPHEQDEVDDEARQKAMKDLVQSWMDRLQLISLITTFLASVEAGLLQVTNGGDDNDSIADQVANATLLSALVLHLHASFISFLASFFLVNFKVKEAKREEAKVEASGNPNGVSSGVGTRPSSKGSVLIDMAAKHLTQSPTTASPRGSTSRSDTTWSNQEHNEKKAQHPGASETMQSKIWSANPRLVQVGPYNRTPPIVLLSRCHSLCILFATIGFVLTMIGIVVYSWAQQSKAVGAVTSGFLGLCLLSGLAIARTSREHRGHGDVFTYE